MEEKVEWENREQKQKREIEKIVWIWREEWKHIKCRREILKIEWEKRKREQMKEKRLEVIRNDK